jgi:signal transduction histidine kinase
MTSPVPTAPLRAGRVSSPGLRLGASGLSVGQKLAAMLALPVLAGAALLAVIFLALSGDRADEFRAAAALDHANRGRDLHVAALEHRDAARDLLTGRGARADLEETARRLEERAREYGEGAAGDGVASVLRARPVLEAARRGVAVAAEAALAASPRPGSAGRIDDAFAREVLPAIEDAARDEAQAARAALAAAQLRGARRLRLGAAAALLSLALALVPTLLFARQLRRSVRGLRESARRIGRGDFSAPVAAVAEGELAELAAALDEMAGELQLRRDRERLVAAAEARVGALEGTRALLEQKVEERTRALARANTDLADNLRRLAEAQQKLLVSDRLAAVGHLAAAVAHEVNNPISCVAANIRFLGEELRALAAEMRGAGTPLEAARESEIASALDDARASAQRVSAIVRDLCTIARGEGEPLARVDVREAIEAALNLATAGFKHHARVDRQFADVPAVTASLSRLGQVFLPLLLHAGRSIAARGPSARGTIRIATFTDERGGAAVEVRDDGAGMTAESLAHLFDPFGPALEQNPASGLGLSVAHGIVASLGGTIEARSSVGGGTSVRVTLPPETGVLATTPAGARTRAA